MHHPPLAVTLGDPAGIGSETVLKALPEVDFCPLWLFGSWPYTAAVPGAEAISSMPRLSLEQALSRRPAANAFVDVALASDPPLRFGQIDPAFGGVALRSIDAALTAVECGACSGLVTAPIHKQAIVAAGSEFHGHTELLAARAGLSRYAHDYAMLFDSSELRVVLLSVHVALTTAIGSIEAETVTALARLTRRECVRLDGREPRIAVAGVNPHAGEGGLFGTEEAIITRGVEAARREGVTIAGPFPADTIFHAAARGSWDVVMAVYHDQGLIPVKTLAFDRSVNVTIGLPYLRGSVDHGTAFDIAGEGLADPGPMRYAMEWTARRAEAYRR